MNRNLVLDLDNLGYQGGSEHNDFLGLGKKAKAKKELRNQGLTRKEARQVVKGKIENPLTPIAKIPTEAVASEDSAIQQAIEAVAGTGIARKPNASTPAADSSSGPYAEDTYSDDSASGGGNMKKGLLIGGGVLAVGAIVFLIWRARS